MSLCASSNNVNFFLFWRAQFGTAFYFLKEAQRSIVLSFNLIKVLIKTFTQVRFNLSIDLVNKVLNAGIIILHKLSQE